MPTNSADPQQLADFADHVRPRAAAVRATLPRLGWALASYRSRCAEFPIDESVVPIADGAVAQMSDLLSGTDRVAAAFALADTGTGPGRLDVRWVDDVELAVLLDEAVSRLGAIEGGHGITADHDTSWSLTGDGLDAGVTASLLIGGRITKEGTLDLGPVTSTTRFTGTAGLSAETDASLTIGKDGVRASAEGEVFAGLKGELENETSFGPCRITTTGTGAAGIGVAGSFDAEISRERVATKVGVLTTLGIGGGGDVEASCDVPDQEDLLRWGSDVERWLDDGTAWVDDRAEAAGDWIGDRTEAAGDWIEDGAEATGDWIGDRLGGLRTLSWR